VVQTSHASDTPRNMVRSAMRLMLGPLTFALLTVVTQIGGIALLLSWLVGRTHGAGGLPRIARTGLFLVVFVATYVAISWLVVPPLAALGGRVPLPCQARGRSAVWRRAPALLRSQPSLRGRARRAPAGADVARHRPGLSRDRHLVPRRQLPVPEWLPLLPHLSHNDGRKLDLAFYYAAPDGTYLPGALRSPIGYWAFETPSPGDPLPCSDQTGLSLRWDLPLLQRLYPNRPIEPERTRAALAWLASEGARHGVERLFVEPHLARRLGVASPLIGFQGCRAARHDDHIHFQIRR
jgi:hypothetical protein